MAPGSIVRASGCRSWADLGGSFGRLGSGQSRLERRDQKPSGDGNYVQGTICLVLRKRLEETNARRMD
jgi:putative DNA methylase